MPHLDAAGNPVAILTFAVRKNGDTSLSVALAKGARNLPAIDAALLILEDIGNRIDFEGDGGDDGGGEDTAPVSTAQQPTDSVEHVPLEDEGVIIVPMDDTPPQEGVVIQ